MVVVADGGLSWAGATTSVCGHLEVEADEERRGMKGMGMWKREEDREGKGIVMPAAAQQALAQCKEMGKQHA
jgi:hypothetical protein